MWLTCFLVCVQIIAPLLLWFTKRSVVEEHDNRSQRELAEKEEVLAQKVRQATFEQLQAKLSQDMATLKQRAPTKESQAVETALDVRYVKERQKMLVLLAMFVFCGASSN